GGIGGPGGAAAGRGPGGVVGGAGGRGPAGGPWGAGAGRRRGGRPMGRAGGPGEGQHDEVGGTLYTHNQRDLAQGVAPVLTAPRRAGREARSLRSRSGERPGRMRRVVSAMAAGLLAAIGSLAVTAPARADSVRSQEWHLSFLEVAKAHQLAQGDGITVAVID